jgi:sugar O-acyltransferase (sialic acid O-acetyltransferase NeuD family)
MTKIVIFGAGDIAELAHFYFQHDSAHNVVAFSVDGSHLKADRFCGLPVIAFENLSSAFPAAEHQAFVAMSYAKINQIRADKCAVLRAAGYRLASYISSRSSIFSDLSSNDNCFILEDNTIQPFVRIGHNVTLWSGNHIGHHSVIEDNVFVSSHVVISGGVTIGDGCFLGVNSTIRDHVKIGRRCVIGAGSLIVADAEDESVYTAAPAEKSRVPSSRLRRI